MASKARTDNVWRQVDASAESERWWEDEHDGGGPQGEDGQVGRLPALEPVEPAASREEPGREPGGDSQVHEEDEVETERGRSVRREAEVDDPGDHRRDHEQVEREGA